MILVDTSVWIEHFRRGDTGLEVFLEANEVAIHPWVLGELALGNLPKRVDTLSLLGSLPSAPMVEHSLVLAMVESERLFGMGIGFVDVQLLASARSMTGTRLWTLDRRLAGVAERLALRH